VADHDHQPTGNHLHLYVPSVQLAHPVAYTNNSQHKLPASITLKRRKVDNKRNRQNATYELMWRVGNYYSKQLEKLTVYVRT